MRKKKINREEVKKALYENLEDVVEKLWRDTDHVKFWIHGKDGNIEISFSDYLTSNTRPNPENYGKNEWLIELKTWNDIAGVTEKEIEKWKEEGVILEAVQEIVEAEGYIKRWSRKSQRIA